MDAEPKVVERMVERSQRPGDVKQFRFRVGRCPGGHAWVFCLGAEIGDFWENEISEIYFRKVELSNFDRSQSIRCSEFLTQKQKVDAPNRSALFQHC